jgi:transposase
MTPRKPYPTNVSDEEWAFAAPYLTLMTEQAPQRKHDLRVMFNALRWMSRAGAPWRLLPNDFPPWEAVYQQTQRWLQAGCFEAMVNDLRSILRVAQGKQGQPGAAIFDGRTLQSTCESGAQAGLLAKEVQQATGETVTLAFVDQGYTGQEAAQAAKAEGIDLQVVKLSEAKKGFVLLPRRWVVERSFGWINRFRRLARDYERLPETLTGLHFVVFTILMLGNAAAILQSS